MYKLLIAVIISCFMMIGCRNTRTAEVPSNNSMPQAATPAPLEEPQLPAEVATQPTTGRIVDSTPEEFMWNIFKISAGNGENTVISPLSIYLALAMVANGADGETAAQFKSILGGTTEDMNKYGYRLMDSLVSNNTPELRIANGIFINDDIDIKANFLDRVRNSYKARVQDLPFNESSSVTTINDWVADTTNGLIRDIITSLSTDDKMVVVNSIYFKAAWRKAFEEMATRNDNFTLSNGTTVEVPFMTTLDRLDIYTDNDMEAIFLPYEDGRYMMAIIIPTEGKRLGDMAGSLNLDNLLTYIDGTQTTTIQLSLPKFEIESSYQLAPILRRMGLINAFDPARADFSNISDLKPLYISEVIHKAKIIVDEAGTEAAAATAVTIRSTSLLLAEREIHVDRPFMYYIWDTENRIPLFIGTVENPE